MTDGGRKSFFEGPKYRFRTGVMEEAHPDEVAYSWLSYDLSRYFFEFVRNFLVVGALKYAADKTGSTFLNVLFWISTGAFIMFVYSFLCFWNVRIFGLFTKHPTARLFDLLLDLMISVAVTFVLYGVIFHVTGQMTAVKQ